MIVKFSLHNDTTFTRFLPKSPKHMTFACHINGTMLLNSLIIKVLVVKATFLTTSFEALSNVRVSDSTVAGCR